ncbi:BPSL0067 family protein [Mesorhizobium comanense]|uniref:BPSL0067 family protein n=1 Tax=Mesorhizobium comanense TaxID=2502215 RepID=UPI0010F57020|nr:BPSL0067 family protein [Mesorhizobium comanense]
MELKPRKTMFPNDIKDQVDDTGDLPGAKDQSEALAPLYDRIELALDKEAPARAEPQVGQPVAALLADLSPGAADALLRQARAANASRLIGAGTDISLAFQNAPKALAETGNYSGVTRGPEDFAAVFGVKEGGRRYEALDRQVRAGKQAFDMRAMPKQSINDQILDAAMSAGHSPDGPSRYQATVAAARQLEEARKNDPAGEAGKAFPQVNAAWRAAADQGWRDPVAVQNALALSLAAQRYLGVENVQPVPQSVLREIGGSSPQDVQAGINGLLAGTADPLVKAAVKQQFAKTGLLGGPAPAPTPALLDPADFDKRFGLPSSTPLKGENGSPLASAPVQSSETLGAGDGPAAADRGSQVPEYPAAAIYPAKVGLTGTVRGGAGWTEIIGPDGRVTRRVGARNWRNNNPGNIEYGPFARSAGAIGSDGRFAVFPDYGTGRAAKSRLLFEGKKYREATISSAMEIYAPRTENDTDKYIKTITSALDVDEDTPLSSLTKQQRSKMMDTMQRVEGFRTGTEYVDGKAVSAPLDGANSNSLIEPTQEVRQEQIDPSPKRSDTPADLALPKSRTLSEGWVGSSTTNISVLPSDIQENARPYADILGKNFGDGECAALTKELGKVSFASAWKRGEQVRGNMTIAPGTPIATFNGDWGDGQGAVHYGPKGYPGGKGRVSHTGIYLGQDEDGIYILDQWNNTLKDKKGHAIKDEKGNSIKTPQKARITYRPWNDPRQGKGGVEAGS